ncbi:MAG: HEPN domain-containing protein, partial [Thermoproteus sp.]
TGSFEKTHSVKRLLRQVVELTGNRELEKMVGEAHIVLELIEQSYITARYLPYEYDKESVERSLNVVRGILHVLGII